MALSEQKPALFAQHEFPSRVEEEIVMQLETLSTVLDYFGWDKARDSVIAAKAEILKMIASDRSRL